jgi:hypothetical protein
MGEHFDELARALASGRSRRQALRSFAAGVAGAALASLMPGRSAEASTNASAACARFCNTAFAAIPGAAVFCITQSVIGKGACFECGPKAKNKDLIPCGGFCCASGSCLRVNGGHQICLPS